ncbi:MAG: ABC transporter substrate-binding protein [Silicimonas sp.]|nr:ABC transporter substrate-binding protein [Silicimonas sp.]RZW06015.1 MAG: ABC transporter substrate-binding protein [Paracoccaceae bacterium]MBT8424800.1 ABC transporter substrate-binding protein [Silicimonas sp.]NND17545.1 ABC transporter substrate-binding protein [Silicimonas sp.]NNL35917.1 ABC transporter substrate-binding protein [Silicimonas sp.]
MSSDAHNLTRRHVLIGLLASTAMLLAPRAFAISEPQAEKLISSAVSDINRVINSGKSERAMYGDFERIFRKYADVPTIARSALGPPARQASSAQMRAFTDAFTGYLARKYGKRFRDFIGGTIDVNGARAVKNFYEVRATANLRGQPPFAISFMVSDRSGSDRFFDLLIEGISLLKSERSEIGAMLDRRRGDIDALVGDLRTAG